MVTTQFFALKIQRYLHDHGLDARLLGEIAAKALRNGSITPHAWRRKPMSVDEIMNATMVNDPLTSYMFCSPSEGGAAVVLMSTERARQVSDRSIEIKALEFRTRRFGTFEVFSPWLAPEITDGATVHAARAAFETAGVGPDEIDVAQLQDTEAGAELMHLAECGFCEHGDQARLILDGELEIGGRLPVNTDGGLIANGEPIGASGLRQVIECVLQLQGRAGDRQVPGAPQDRVHAGVRRAGHQRVFRSRAMTVGSVPAARARPRPNPTATPSGRMSTVRRRGRRSPTPRCDWPMRSVRSIWATTADCSSSPAIDRRRSWPTPPPPSGEAASVPVNFHLTSGEISYIAAESGARLAFVDSTTLEAARDGARRNRCGDRRAPRQRNRRAGFRRIRGRSSADRVARRSAGRARACCSPRAPRGDRRRSNCHRRPSARRPRSPGSSSTARRIASPGSERISSSDRCITTDR